MQKGNTTYAYDSSAGEGTCSYIVDTGILTSHPEFEGRAEWLENFTGDGKDSDGAGKQAYSFRFMSYLTSYRPRNALRRYNW